MKTRLLYAFSDINNAAQFERLINEMSRKYLISLIFYGKSENSFCAVVKKLNVEFIFIRFDRRSLLSYLKCTIRSVYYLLIFRPDIVHCHLFAATRLMLPLSWLLRVPRRIFTRHHAGFHHTYHPKGVLLDRINNICATRIIAPSAVVEDILLNQENCSQSKIRLIYHWFQVNDTSLEQVICHPRFQKKSDLVVGVVSRFLDLKGHVYIINAFSKYLEIDPSAKLLLASPYGPDSQKVYKNLDSLPRSSWSTLADPLPPKDLFHKFDVFLHVPVSLASESFGQVFIESMLYGVPSIFTLSGISAEVCTDRKNCLIVPYRSSEAIFQGLVELLRSPALRLNLSRNGCKTSSLFSFENHIDGLVAIYSE